MIPRSFSAFASRGAVLSCAALLVIALAASILFAQAGPTISIRILDGKTGRTIDHTNLLIRVDRIEEPHNEGLKLNGAEPDTAQLPPGATMLSVQGAYNASVDLYINCDTDTGKEGGELKWYSIADILKTGVVAPDLCYKGRYEHKLNITAKPGEFVFFVRTHGWRDILAD